MNLLSLVEFAESMDVGTIGKNMFIQNLPEGAASLSIMFKNSLEGTLIDYELPLYRKGKFQAIIRCKANNFESGRELAQLVSDVLTINEMTLGNYLYRYVRPVSEPIGYQLSDGANYEFSVNFAAVYVIVS